MGYIDDGHSLFSQGLHDLKQHLCLALGKGCRGLIHDDDFCVHHQGLTNFYHLLLSHGELRHHLVRGDADPQTF